MATLREIAERVQDLYWQNYPANDSFLDLDDFKFQVATVYSAMLSAQYQIERKQNKAMEGFSNIEIPAAWLIEETLTLEADPDDPGRFLATTSQPVFSFDWDNAANALQGVHSAGGKHCLYRKISLNERRFRQVIPPISAVLYFLNNPKQIVFWGAKGCSKVKVQYVPSVVGQEDDCLLSDNIVAPLVERVLTVMLQARNGTFVQKADNQNPNVVPQQQVDPAISGPK